jgi:glutathione S-transferase
MADVAMWTDKKAKAAFATKAKARLEELQAELEGHTGVVAIEPESGEYFVGATLGKADAAAYEKHPDVWVYFARLDDPEAAIALPTW